MSTPVTGEGAVYPYYATRTGSKRPRVNEEGESFSSRSEGVHSWYAPGGDYSCVDRVPVGHVSFNYPAAAGSMNTRLVDVTQDSTGTPVAAPTVSVSTTRECEVFSGQAGNSTSGSPNTAAVKLLRTARYIAGQGLTFRFSTRFDAPTTLTEQGVGVGQLTEDLIAVGHFAPINGGDTGFAIRFSSFTSGAQVNTLIKQTAFNIDKLDGTGDSKIVLDPTKGNVFQLDVKWYGYACIVFFIESASNGLFYPFHIFEFANQRTTPSIANPSALSPIAYSRHADYAASPSAAVTVRTTSMGAFENGTDPTYGVPNAVANLKNTTDSIILSLRVSTKFPVGGSVNNYNYINMGNLSLSVNGGNKPGKFTIILNPSSITSASFSAVSANTSMVELDTAGTAVSGGFTWTVITLNPGQSTIVPIDELLFRGQTISVRFQTTGTASDAEAALNFRELF